MITLNQMLKKTMMLITVLLIAVTKVSAQSTVYVFAPTLSNSEASLLMNGNVIGSILGPLKKEISPVSPMKIPHRTYKPTYKKCTIKEEGKVLFAAYIKFTNGINLNVSEHTAEIQLNLSEGSVHYIRVSPKGLNNIQFKEISEKDAKKYFKKNYELPEYIQE